MNTMYPWHKNVKLISKTFLSFSPLLTADGGWLPMQNRQKSFRISDLAAPPHHVRAPCSPSFLLPKILLPCSAAQHEGIPQGSQSSNFKEYELVYKPCS